MAVLGGCGRPICLVSSGICGRITFGSEGSGPDEHGYFGEPCYLCAKAWKAKYPNEEVWPDEDAPSVPAI